MFYKNAILNIQIALKSDHLLKVPHLSGEFKYNNFRKPDHFSTGIRILARRHLSATSIPS